MARSSFAAIRTGCAVCVLVVVAMLRGVFWVIRRVFGGSGRYRQCTALRLFHFIAFILLTYVLLCCMLIAWNGRSVSRSGLSRRSAPLLGNNAPGLCRTWPTNIFFFDVSASALTLSHAPLHDRLTTAGHTIRGTPQ